MLKYISLACLQLQIHTNTSRNSQTIESHSSSIQKPHAVANKLLYSMFIQLFEWAKSLYIIWTRLETDLTIFEPR